LEEILGVVVAASAGRVTSRVAIPDPLADDPTTRVGVALNVLLDDLATRARATERSDQRVDILADAARAFADDTQDPERLVDTVARRLAEVVRDQCVVRLVSEDGSELLPVAVRGVDEVAEGYLREMYREPLRLADYPAAQRVHETGEPFIVPKLDFDAVQATTAPKVVEWGRRIGVHSLLMLPLRHRGTSFGQLLLTRYRDDSPSFHDGDVKLARALADHAAIALANARSHAAERTARAVAERAIADLHVSEARYRSMFDQSPLPKWVYDADTLGFLDVNDAFVRDFGYSREELLKMTIKDVRPPEDVAALLEAERDGGPGLFGVCRLRKKSGATAEVEITKHTFVLAGRLCRMAVGRDVSERLRLEQQLRQSQKMEAVGTLAGGIAHDFNNMLQVILSHAELLLGELGSDEPKRESVEEIQTAGRRAADLTRQLLAFSRQQVVAPVVVDLNDVVTRVDRMLRRILGADIDLMWRPTMPLGRVWIDPGSMEQVVMNLAVNARDAMPTGGKLTLETANVTLDEGYARDHLGVKPGPHVMLAVTDTGTGIDPAALPRILEPFFTTKETGKGTGLGLAMVFGIIQQSGGSIWVYSEPSRGTCFKIYLPCVDADVDPRSSSLRPSTLRGDETILVVEDDDQVRRVVCGILRDSGYNVLAAPSPGDALLAASNYPSRIHLLLTDVVMPKMSGPELARHLVGARPDMKVLCMSGYTDDSIVRHGVIESEMTFVQKPVTPDALTVKVREVLDRARG